MGAALQISHQCQKSVIHAVLPVCFLPSDFFYFFYNAYVICDGYNRQMAYTNKESTRQFNSASGQELVHGTRYIEVILRERSNWTEKYIEQLTWQVKRVSETKFHLPFQRPDLSGCKTFCESTSRLPQQFQPLLRELCSYAVNHLFFLKMVQ